jgi:hypothetical protein
MCQTCYNLTISKAFSSCKIKQVASNKSSLLLKIQTNITTKLNWKIYAKVIKSAK